jgi:hypothetical protein
MKLKRENKRELLFQLRHLQELGIALTIPVSMDTPEHELATEYERHMAHIHLKQRIGIMKGLVKFGVVMVRFGLGFFKVFRLEGWMEFVHAQLDSGAFDMALEQLYRAFWRRGAPSPWLAITVLIVVSGVVYHMKNTGQMTVATSGNNSLMSSLMSLGGMVVGPLMSQLGGGAAAGAPDFGVGYAPTPAHADGSGGGGNKQQQDNGSVSGGGGGGGGLDFGAMLGTAANKLAVANMRPRATTVPAGGGRETGYPHAATRVRVQEPARPPVRRQVVAVKRHVPPAGAPPTQQQADYVVEEGAGVGGNAAGNGARRALPSVMTN